MKPTDEQLRDPKWWDENAPTMARGAWVVRNMIDKDIRAVNWTEDKSEGCLIAEDCQASFYKRPTSQLTDKPEWDHGIPPVGCECEYQPDPKWTEIWHKCVFLAHMDGEFFVLRDENGEVDRMGDSVPASRRFRPLKTQAEREREELIEVMTEGVDAKEFASIEWYEHACRVIQQAASATMARYELKERNQ